MDGLTWVGWVRGCAAPQGHKLKNPKMQLVKALRGVRTRRTLLLSGTPIQNNLEELWALMDLVAPSVLGDQREFKDTFQKRIVAGSARCATAPPPPPPPLPPPPGTQGLSVHSSLLLRRVSKQVQVPPLSAEGWGRAGTPRH